MEEENVTGIWFEIPGRVDKAFTRLLVFSDRGQFILRFREIEFIGDKYKYIMKKPKNIQLYFPRWFATKGVPYIKIEYVGTNGQPQKAFFLRGAVYVWGVNKRTLKLYQELLKRYPDPK